MGPTEQLRTRTAQVLGVALVLVSLAGIVSALAGGVDDLLDYGAALALLGLLGWAALWRPCIQVSDGGVVVVNTWRTVEVPWPAIDGVHGRYGLRLDTAYGPVTAWAAGAPAGRQRARGEQSLAADVVSGRLEALRAAGHLDDRRLERPELRTTWNRALIAAAAVLLVAAVLLPLLT
jgi:PH (Pleckstrin Homology) domain-containing protein